MSTARSEAGDAPFVTPLGPRVVNNRLAVETLTRSSFAGLGPGPVLLPAIAFAPPTSAIARSLARAGLPGRPPHLPVRHHSAAEFVTPVIPSDAHAISVLPLTFLVSNSVAANGLARTAGDCCSQRFSLGSPV